MFYIKIMDSHVPIYRKANRKSARIGSITDKGYYQVEREVNGFYKIVNVGWVNVNSCTVI